MLAVEMVGYQYTYPGRESPALKAGSIRAREGDFILLSGPSGGGKSTLLRAIRGIVPRFHGGAVSGRIKLMGRDIREYSARELATLVGFVFQDPESQLFMTRVAREVGFGLQNLEAPTDRILRDIAEALNCLGVADLRDRAVSGLSGGEKQKVAMAAVLAMRPRILLLDEPTSQLDPVAADELLRLVKRVNEDLGVTVIMAEQHIDRCFSLADSVLFCERGSVVDLGTPREAARQLTDLGMEAPTLARLFAACGHEALPLTVREARVELNGAWRKPAGDGDGRVDGGSWVDGDGRVDGGSWANRGMLSGGSPVLHVQGVRHHFETPDRGSKDVLSGISLTARAGEFIAILGENGAGKSTLLRVISGLIRPSEGRVRWPGRSGARDDEGRGSRVALLSQNPSDHLTEETVREEIETSRILSRRPAAAGLDHLVETLGLAPLLDCNPRDLSCGERQRVALASVLATGREALLLDEPTRGMDPAAKRLLGRLLRDVSAAGSVVILVTHDVDLVAEYASRVIIMSGGTLVADGTPEMALDRALYFSPQVNRLFGDHVSGVVAYGQALRLLKEGLKEGLRDGK